MTDMNIACDLQAEGDGGIIQVDQTANDVTCCPRLPAHEQKRSVNAVASTPSSGRQPFAHLAVIGGDHVPLAHSVPIVGIGVRRVADTLLAGGDGR